MTTRFNLALAYLALAALLAVGLAGCGTTKPRVVTQEVRTPVLVRCVADLAPAPTYAGDLTSLDGTIFDLTRALLIEREQRKVRELELNAALEGCR
jgi:hypothetical protein